MKKLFKVVFVAILAIAIAAPAMAEVKVNGYIRTIMQSDNVAGVGAKDAPTASQVDNRLRAKITNQLTDNVKWVYYGEVDTKWGQDTGGKLGADGVQLQTKNVYMEFNVPNSMISAKVGVQGFTPGFNGFLLNHDAAGAAVNLAVSDTMAVVLHYSKFDEGDKSTWDDINYYAAVGKMKLANDAKLNLMAAYVDDNSVDYTPGSNEGKDDIYWVGAEYMGKIGDIGLNTWVMYNGGTYESDSPAEGDLSGYAATVQAVFGKAAVRLLYTTGDDGTNGTDSDEFAYDIGGAYYFYNENLQCFFTDKYYNNLGATNLDKAGNGLTAITAKYDTMVGDYYLKLGVGYFMSSEDINVGGSDEDELGTELAARFGTTLVDKLDVSVNGSYVLVGDALAGSNNDDIFKINLMLNLPY